ADDVAILAVDADVVAAVADHFDNGAVGVELPAQLVEVADLEVRAELHRAGIRNDLAEHDPEQRALADTVVADKPDAIAAHDLHRQSVDELFVAVAVMDVVQLDDLAARGVGFLDADASLVLRL